MKWAITLPRRSPGGEPRGKRWWSRPLRLSLSAGLIFAVFSISFYLSLQSSVRSNQVRVPELEGLDVEEAATSAEGLGLVIQIVDQRHDPSVQSGRVLEQTPQADSSVRRGRKIKVVVSLGGEVLEVPDLIGHANRAVAIELRQVGFFPGDEARVPNRRSQPGTVLAQVPAAGTPAVPKTRIHRLIADGLPPATWVMPDLTGLSQSRAELWISQSGLRRGAVRRVRMGGRVPDSVVGQLPLAGYPVRKTDVIELTVAR